MFKLLRGSLQYYLLATLGAVGMGTVGAIAKFANVGSDAVTFFRLGFGLVCLLLYLASIGELKVIQKKPSQHSLANGIFLAGFIAFYIHAMDYLNMVTAIMVLYIAPIFASIIAHLFLNERLSLPQLLTILLAFFGFGMVFEFRVTFTSNELLGLGLVGIATLCYTGFIIVNRLTDKNVSAYSRSVWQLFAGALCMLPFAWQEAASINMTQLGWMWIAGVVPGFMGIVCSVIALQKLSATAFGTLAYMEVVTVAVLGWLLFDETMSIMQSLGCVLIIFSGIVQAYLSQTMNQSRKCDIKYRVV